MSDKKTVIITGGNSGLGFECGRNIASNPSFHVILACRNMDKAEQAAEELIKDTGNPNIEGIELDVSSLSSVQAFVRKYREMKWPLFGLICNAGINGMSAGLTKDGFDIVFETNHLGHFLLANLLLPVMLPEGRIAVVSSDMHCPPGAELTWPGVEALAHPDEALAASTLRYSYSKLCNLYFTYALSERLARIGSKITVNALNPGLMADTNFAPNKARFTPEFLERVSDRIGSLEESAKTLADMITSPQYALTTGKYFDRGLGIKSSSPLSYNRDNTLELWGVSAKLANLTQDEVIQGLI